MRKSMLRQLRKAEAAVSEFKAATRKIEATCRAVSDTVLLSVERKRLYGNAEFADVQAQHRALVSLFSLVTSAVATCVGSIPSGCLGPGAQ